MSAWSAVVAFVRRHPFAPGLIFAVVLLVANLLVAPQFLSPRYLASTLGILAPFVFVALASTPAVLSGGIDISVGPLMTFLNCLFVAVLVPAGLGGLGVALPIVLGLGAAAGALNGVLVTLVRLHPVVATTGTLFLFVGGALVVAPEPASVAGSWTRALATSVGSVPGALLLLVPVAVALLALNRTAFVRNLLAVGDDDVSAFGAGIHVTGVRILAYALGGLLAGVGALALTALIQSAEPSLATVYALIGLAAVVIGGTPLGGGSGGMVGSAIGAGAIYLLQQLLTAWGVQANLIQLTYGVVLVCGVVLSAATLTDRRRAA